MRVVEDGLQRNLFDSPQELALVPRGAPSISLSSCTVTNQNGLFARGIGCDYCTSEPAGLP